MSTPEPPDPTPSAMTCRCGHDKSQHFGMETPHCRECLRLRRAGYIHDFLPPASAPPPQRRQRLSRR